MIWTSDSGATHNVRKIKKDENYQGSAPIEVEVAFDAEVKAELFMNKQQTRYHSRSRRNRNHSQRE